MLRPQADLQARNDLTDEFLSVILTEMPRNSVELSATPHRRGRPPRAGVVLAELPRGMRKSRYPWREWEDGQPRVIWYPEHFRATTAGMRSTLMTHARKADIAIACVSNPEHPHAPAEDSLAFQFFPGRRFADGPPA
jgi:hypothetical protein